MDVNNDIVTETPLLNSSVNEESSSFFSMTLFRYLLILLIIAFLAYNIYSYLGKDKIMSFFRHEGREERREERKERKEVKQIPDNAGIKVLDKTLSGKEEKRRNRDPIPKPDILPDDAGSRTQSSKSKSGTGFCYIGEDRGFRSCINVGEGDVCMSGDIFPTMDKCINPNLR